MSMDKVTVTEIFRPYRFLVTIGRSDYKRLMETKCARGVLFQIQVLETGDLSFAVPHKDYVLIGDNLYGGRLSPDFYSDIQKVADNFIGDALKDGHEFDRDYDYWADKFLGILHDKYEGRFLAEMRNDLGPTLACICASELLRNYICREFFPECSWLDRWKEEIDIYVN